MSASGTAAASARATAPAECSSCFYFVLQSYPSDRCTFSPKIPRERSVHSKALSFRDLFVHELSEFFFEDGLHSIMAIWCFSDVLCFTIYPETNFVSQNGVLSLGRFIWFLVFFPLWVDTLFCCPLRSMTDPLAKKSLTRCCCFRRLSHVLFATDVSMFCREQNCLKLKSPPPQKKSFLGWTNSTPLPRQNKRRYK